MSSPERFTEHDIEPLVGAYLQNKSTALDAATGLGRIKSTLGSNPTCASTGARGRWSRRKAAWVAGSAVAAVLTLTIAFQATSGRATAQELIQEARRALVQPTDRCYLVETRPGTGVLAPLIPPARVTLLWTRGDCFCVESVKAPRNIAWGRDEQGSIWLALDSENGVRFDADERPERLALWADFLTLRVDSLLDDLLHGFDLRLEAAAGSHIIRAEPKAGQKYPRLRSALLEMDTETRQLKRMVLSRLVGGVWPTTSTFTLIDTRPQDDSLYQLTSHLDADAQVFSKNHLPEQRRLLLLQRFGPFASENAAERRQ